MLNDWKDFLLEDIFNISSGKTSKYSKDTSLMYPVYGSNGPIGSFSESNFEDGFLIGRVGAVGFVHKISHPVWASDNTLTLEITDNLVIDKNFIQYVLNRLNLKKYATTTAQPLLTQKNLKKIALQLPSIMEQQKIAAILTSVDEAIEKTEAIIEQTEKVKKGLMQELLTKGIGHTKFKNTEIGDIPVKWNLSIIDSFAKVTRLAGYEYSEVWQTDTNGSIIALRGYNIGENEIKLKDVEKITEELSQRLVRSKLFKGDIVFPCVGTIGKAVLIEENDKYHINQNIAKITADKKIILPEFLVHVLMSDVTKKQIIKFNTSSSQPNVLVGSLRQFLVPIPPVDEQRKISSVINSLATKINIEKDRLERLIIMKQGLMQNLLTGKRRIKVDEPEVVS